MANIEKDKSPAAGYVRRAAAAHNNSLEAFSFWAAAVLLSIVTGVDAALVSLTADIFLTLRFFYNFIYIVNVDRVTAGLRSLLWLGSLLCSVFLMYTAASTAQ